VRRTPLSARDECSWRMAAGMEHMGNMTTELATEVAASHAE
jgi:hypothetical protein